MKAYFKNKLTLLGCLGLIALLTNCSVQKQAQNKVSKQFNSATLLNKYHVGFALFDLANEKMLYQKNADKYFIPASNTKLFTFYAVLKIIPDSVPSLRYIETGDSLIFWGTGDPSFLQSDLKGINAYKFLKQSDKKLFFAPGRYTGNFYGTGWQWDDYNDYYQAEINELPLMDNLITVKEQSGKMQISPKTFSNCFVMDSALKTSTFKVIRQVDKNEFEYPEVNLPINYKQQIPYKTNIAATLSILADTLQKPISLIGMKMPNEAKTIYNVKRDSVLKQMLLPSDNFIAEQLLLVCADVLKTDLNTQKTIDYVTKNYLTTLPDKPKWVDGSGLSRLNLFTPRDMVTLLNLIYKEVNNPQKLFSMLPAGGKSGTLKNAYPKTDSPFVYGKTGTLTNNYNQSGYILTKSGKTYIFSFMNNNFVEPTAEVRAEIGRIITYIHDSF